IRSPRLDPDVRGVLEVAIAARSRDGPGFHGTTMTGRAGRFVRDVAPLSRCRALHERDQRTRGPPPLGTSPPPERPSAFAWADTIMEGLDEIERDGRGTKSGTQRRADDQDRERLRGDRDGTERQRDLETRGQREEGRTGQDEAGTREHPVGRESDRDRSRPRTATWSVRFEPREPRDPCPQSRS